MVRQLSTLAREVAWVSQDVWSRVRDHLDGPSNRVAHRDRVLAEDVLLREGRVIVTEEPPVSALRVLEAAAAAAEVDAPFERATLLRLRSMSDPTWDVWERAAFLRLLRAGAGAIPVFEALDHEGVLVRILPEWEHVRSRPQRNAYHRFTVDRHLLEALAICAELLDAGDAPDPGFDADVDASRACRRPELLLLGALLHDIGKGMPADHSDVGADDRVAGGAAHRPRQRRPRDRHVARAQPPPDGRDRDPPRPLRRERRRQPRRRVRGRRRAVATALPAHDRRLARHRPGRVGRDEGRAAARPLRQGRGRDRAG